MQKVQSYAEGLDLDRFKADEKTIDAVVRNLEVIGEATKKLPVELRLAMPGVDWPRIAGLRDVLIHEYFAVDLDIIWDVVTNKVPQLRTAIEQFLSR